MYCLCQTVLLLYLVGNLGEKCRTEQSSLRPHIELMHCFCCCLCYCASCVCLLLMCVIPPPSLILNIFMYVCMQNVDLIWGCQQKKSRNRHRTVTTERLYPRGSRSSALSSSLECLLRWVGKSQHAVSKWDKWKNVHFSFTVTMIWTKSNTST